MGLLGGGQDAGASRAPWGRRGWGWEDEGEQAQGPPHRCSGAGPGQRQGQRPSTLPAHPANGRVSSS